MFTWIRRIFITIALLGLVTSNVLSLTHSAFNAALSGIVSTAFGVRTVSGMMQAKIASQGVELKKQAALQADRQRSARKFGARLASRTKRVAAKSIAAIPAEAIPFVGVAVLIADTGYELYAACETLRDLDELYRELGIEEGTPDDTMHSVCNPQLPDPGDVWDGVIDRSGEWLDLARDAM